MTIVPGVVSSYAGLVTARASLGLCEGPMFPGIVLYLSGFYTREELSLRSVLAPSFISLILICVLGLHYSFLLHRYLEPSPDCLRLQYRIWMVSEGGLVGNGSLFWLVYLSSHGARLTHLRV